MKPRKWSGAGIILGVDYPNFEVVAVNDRSVDATQQILELAAARDARLKQ